MRDLDHNEHVNDRLRYLQDKYEAEGLPLYPNLGATVAKLRKRAADICIVHRAVARREHGNAVLEAIRKLNYRSLQRELVEPPEPYIGNPRQRAAKLLKAIFEQNAGAAYAKIPFNQREANRKYDLAMIEKKFETNLNGDGSA
jgi:hypothetical protein